MRRARLLSIVIALIGFGAGPGFAAPGDDPSIGLIVYAEGETMMILRERVQTRLDVGVGDALGEPLYAGDQVSTDAGTSAEIQLLSSRNIVRIAENTTFVVENLARGGSTLHLTYGRLRARVEQIAGAGRFEMRGVTAVAGVRGTDFGYDQYVDPVTGELLDRIYCLEGEIHVSSVDDPSLAVVLPAGRMIVVTAGTAPDSVVVTPLDEAITRYWEARPFSRDIASARTLVQEFPGLAERVESDLGTLPEVLAIDESVVQEPAVAVPEEEQQPATRSDVETQRIEPSVVIEAEPAGDGEAEQRNRVARGLRTTGIVLAGTGLLVDIAAVGLYYFGDAIFAGWTAENNAILGPVAATGVGLLAGGIIAIMISLGVSN